MVVLITLILPPADEACVFRAVTTDRPWKEEEDHGRNYHDKTRPSFGHSEQFG